MNITSAANSTPIVIIDDEESILHSFSLLLKMSGIGNVVTFSTSRDVMPFLSSNDAAVIVLDLYMPDISGSKLLSEIKQVSPHIPVIIMTAANDVETAVNCMKTGAFDYLIKPVQKDRFLPCIRRALEINELRNEVRTLKGYLIDGKLKHPDAFLPIITASTKMKAVLQYTEAVAPSSQPVLITGETGVGKELVAKAIHELSGRSGKFIAVNIAGLDSSMFSDTLFGHEKGAYTGADQTRDGIISQAEGGTLFLDEIGDLSMPSQVKLLRLIQEHDYYQLGSDITKKTDARIVVATNKDLPKMIAENKFRKDLYYRLRSHHINIPPLRERTEDISILVHHFLVEAAESMKKKVPTPPRELFTLLSVYHFPGNVRELGAMIYDAVARHESGVLSTESFRKSMDTEHPLSPGSCSQDQTINAISCSFQRFPTLKEVTDYFVDEALRISNGNQVIASSLLGITRQTLNRKLKNTD